MKEQLVSQLKTQIADLERFIHYLQGEVNPETLACTCACPVHTRGPAATSSRRTFPKNLKSDEGQARNLNTVQKIVTLLHVYVMSQLSCGSQNSRRPLKKNSIYNWRELRTKLDIAVELVLQTVAESEFQVQGDEEVANDLDFGSDSDSTFSRYDAKVTAVVRKHLAIRVRDLIHHGLMTDARANSVVPFVGCFPQRSQPSTHTMHAWELILKYYEFKNGHRYNCSPAQKLSQSFKLDLIGDHGNSSKQVQNYSSRHDFKRKL